MPAARQTVVKPLGLMTRPNEYGAYPAGAMAVANNILFRSSTQFQCTKDVSGAQALSNVNDVVRKLFPLDSGIIWSASRTAADLWVLGFGASFGSIPSAMSSTGLLSNTGFISPLRMRDHFLVNGLTNVIVSDVMAPASAADRTFRMAGMPQAAVNQFTAASAAAGAVANNTTVGYCVLLKRVFANGYEVISTPSVVYRYINSSGAAVNVQLRVQWLSASGIAAGDIVEVYRTDALAAVLATSDPGTTCKLVLSYTLQAADIAATFTTVTDTQAPGPLGVTYGRELYTNPGQGGALSANRQPNISKLTASYKGFAFYANITERPIWTYSVPGGISGTSAPLVTDYERTYGIGQRDITATTTLGNATVTGVSATHLLGIKVGQLLSFGSGGSFPNNAFTVQSINSGAGTITFTGVATAGVVGATLSIIDQFQLDGGTGTITGLGSMVAYMGGQGTYEVTSDQTVAAYTGLATQRASGFTVSVEPSRPAYATTITVRATNGANYQPPIPEFTAAVKTFTQTARPNMLQWSHEQQPEHVPPSNSAFVGSGAIIGLASTRDALWIFCTDGLFRLSGDGGQWRIDQLDTTLILSAPQCAAVLRDAVFAYTNRGLVRIADDGFDELSDITIGDALVGPAYVETPALIVERDETSDEIWVIDTGVTGGAPSVWVYATVYAAWSKLSFTTVTALAYQRIPTNPATQPNGWMVVGRSPLAGAQPSYALFDQNSTAANLTATVQFQPFYGDDPMLAKHWIDATWIFAGADATRTLGSTWQGVADGTNTLTAWLNGDTRATFGIPRSVAVAPAISPGFTLASGVVSPPVCKGLSVRYQPLTEQQVYR